jgi:hypothetical protein
VSLPAPAWVVAVAILGLGILATFFLQPTPESRPEPVSHKPPPFMGCDVLPRNPNDPNCRELPDLGDGWSHCLSGTEADQRACRDLKRKYEQDAAAAPQAPQAAVATRPPERGLHGSALIAPPITSHDIAVLTWHRCLTLATPWSDAQREECVQAARELKGQPNATLVNGPVSDRGKASREPPR